MAFNARILADSISPAGHRLTTFELTFPRVILAEFNTHRMISRNAASSRAIPTEKLIHRVLDDPFIPEFCVNKKGMQAGGTLHEDHARCARKWWLDARDDAVKEARALHGLNIHKQYVNRLLEPWMWCTVIASATDWANLFHLRCSPEAEPSFQTIANMALDLYRSSEPTFIEDGGWHLPLIENEDYDLVESYLNSSAWNDPVDKTTVTDNLIEEYLCKASVGRCARVSYLTHDGKRDVSADVDLHDRLRQSGHWSPFEHVATPLTPDDNEYHESGYNGNFRGWRQYRKEFANENITNLPGVIAL